MIEKGRRHLPAARVFCMSLVFSNARRVSSQCNTRLKLLYLVRNAKHEVNYILLYSITGNSYERNLCEAFGILLTNFRWARIFLDKMSL